MKKKQLISVSTKTGDDGTSGLANGQRLAKSAPVFSVLGDIDELNSWLGLIVAHMGSRWAEQRVVLEKVQDSLFYVGAELAQSPNTKLDTEVVKLVESATTSLQNELADDWTTKFLLPGGSVLGAYCDVARSVCRRSERGVVGYTQSVPVSDTVRQFINRLSDYLFVLRCWLNQQQEVIEKKFVKKLSK